MSYGTVIHQTSAKIAGSTVHLRLLKEGEHLLVERELIEADHSKQTQVLSVKALDSIRKFIDADPLYSRFEAQFEQLYLRAMAVFKKGGAYV